MFSPTRISTIRKSKGVSQEVLAEQSGVSLRTIQRVEQGDTMPRGYTLQALAAALEVPLEAFRAEPEVTPEHAPTPVQAAAPEPQVVAPAPASVLRPDPQFLQLLNLSALSFLVFPLLNLVVPWVLWRKHRHDTEQAAEVGRRVLGFQILWQVLCFLSYGLAAVAQLWAHLYQVVLPNLFVWVFIISYLLNLAVVCYNGWKLRRGHLDIYPFRL
ncbi:helix-turn-helix domain-containing protein [Hymenobacter wooponensis]|uniref:Helix-turn-helix domain-containing protein n=1 Tax=Hymenobacter wooponensis TaxID=1525360 RepID=A0A4Z0MF08_9BACT|nr:helix-turn-helix domain-containing protein [Hymenobacter wooponensis]TGD77950.1 helix-turn-helix domain-containing protein [Hymenobacter wooponensis]